jgi:hypothetical protein
MPRASGATGRRRHEVDNLIITHWHGDHFGGLAELAKQIPIRQYIDHGANVQAAQAVDDFLKDVYPGLTAKGTHMVAKPGDKLAVKDLDWRVVASAGQVLKTNLSGAGRPNPYCGAVSPAQAPDPTENAQSVSSYITFGKFRIVHMGDLTYNKELDLMCPTNRLGGRICSLASHTVERSRIRLRWSMLSSHAQPSSITARAKADSPTRCECSSPHRVSRICGRCTSRC